MARLTPTTHSIGVALALWMASVLVAQPSTDLPQLTPPVTLDVIGAGELPAAYALLPEGTFLTKRLMHIVPIGTHARAAVFVRSGDDAPIRPMALLPCANTLAIEQLAGTSQSPLLFEASGQVFISKGLNYFLPLIVRVASHDELDPVAEEPKAPHASPDGPPLLERTADDIAVEDLIRELEAASAADAGVRGEAGRPLSLQREGGVVTLRRGRLIRGGSGVPVFQFDSGAVTTDPELDIPMGLMPCSLTDEMERIASRRGDHITLTVSGRVFLYDEANYLLPTMFFVNSSGAGGLSSAH